MRPERRLSRYKQEDVWIQLVHLQSQLRVKLIANTVHGNSVSLLRYVQVIREGKPVEERQEHRAVILARSSDWYYWSLNCTDRFKHGITCIVCATHDSCIDRPVLALDTMRWYEEKKIRGDWGPLQPRKDQDGNLIPDSFDTFRKTQYGHNMLLGSIMQRRPDALERLALLPDRTRFRMEAEVRRLHKRRVGHPFVVWPVERPQKTG